MSSPPPKDYIARIVSIQKSLQSVRFGNDVPFFEVRLLNQLSSEFENSESLSPEDRITFFCRSLSKFLALVDTIEPSPELQSWLVEAETFLIELGCLRKRWNPPAPPNVPDHDDELARLKEFEDERVTTREIMRQGDLPENTPLPELLRSLIAERHAAKLECLAILDVLHSQGYQLSSLEPEPIGVFLREQATRVGAAEHSIEEKDAVIQAQTSRLAAKEKDLETVRDAMAAQLKDLAKQRSDYEALELMLRGVENAFTLKRAELENEIAWLKAQNADFMAQLAAFDTIEVEASPAEETALAPSIEDFKRNEVQVAPKPAGPFRKPSRPRVADL